jgi:hypothetical protein
MTEVRIGSEVTYGGRAFRVRGISPMGAGPRRLFLEDVETAESLKVDLEDVSAREDETLGNGSIRLAPPVD